MAVGLTMSVIPAALACLEQTRRDPLGLLVLPIDQFWKDMCEHSTTHAHVPITSRSFYLFFFGIALKIISRFWMCYRFKSQYYLHARKMCEVYGG